MLLCTYINTYLIKFLELNYHPIFTKNLLYLELNVVHS